MSTIGPKGQVVIPVELRRKFGLKPGMKVDFKAGLQGPMICVSLDNLRPLRGKYHGKLSLNQFITSKAMEGNIGKEPSN